MIMLEHSTDIIYQQMTSHEEHPEGKKKLKYYGQLDKYYTFLFSA